MSAQHLGKGTVTYMISRGSLVITKYGIEECLPNSTSNVVLLGTLAVFSTPKSQIMQFFTPSGPQREHFRKEMIFHIRFGLQKNVHLHISVLNMEGEKTYHLFKRSVVGGLVDLCNKSCYDCSGISRKQLERGRKCWKLSSSFTVFKSLHFQVP